MNDYVQLKPLFERLRMNGIVEILDSTLNDAIEQKWSYSQLLLHLFTNEVERRNHKQLCYRLSRSNLDPDQTLETFDFNFNKNISQRLIKELALCDFINNKQNIFFVGPSGVGKTHLANAIGHEACRKGYNVLMNRTNDFLEWVQSGYGDGSHQKRKDSLIKAPLLILDDFGLVPLKDHHQVCLYDIISSRSGKASTIITSNRDFSEWLNVFNNTLMGTAAMDRLVFNAIKISIDGDSFRYDQFNKNQKEKFGKKEVN